MALSISRLIDDAARQVQDEAHVRFTRAEWLDYFNAAQRRLVQLRPDVLAPTEHTLTLVRGFRQTVPTGMQLIDVVCNASGLLEPVTLTESRLLDALDAGWRTHGHSSVAVHYTADRAAQGEFWVYPPAVAGMQVKVLLVADVQDVASEADTATVASRWFDALREFMLYRAWSKDAEFAGQAQLADRHLALFHAAIGVASAGAGDAQP